MLEKTEVTLQTRQNLNTDTYLPEEVGEVLHSREEVFTESYAGNLIS